MKDLEPERLDRLEQVAHGVFARPGAFGGVRLDLKVRQQVVGQRDQLLPRAIGRVGIGGDGVKGEAGLQLADRLLCGSRAPP